VRKSGGAGLQVSIGRECELDEGVHAGEKHLAGTLQMTDARGGEVVMGVEGGDEEDLASCRVDVEPGYSVGRKKS
jgi:hypothetical protein